MKNILLNCRILYIIFCQYRQLLVLCPSFLQLQDSFGLLIGSSISLWIRVIVGLLDVLCLI